MKYFSLFSGIGGFELGIQQTYDELVENSANTLPEHDTEELESWRWVGEYAPHCVGFSEIDKYAIQIYEKHFNHQNYGDITKIKELPDFDLLVGGFPCQAFSIAGKRGGFNDTRGTLFFEIARLLKLKQPRLFLLENVKGLLSHDEGRTFRTIITTLDELGYDLQWQVLNSKDFGVPQNRERVFIVGHLRGTRRPEVFPFGETAGTTNERPNEGDTEVASTLRSRYGNGTGSHVLAHYGHKDKPPVKMNISPTLKAQSHGHEPMVVTQKSAEADSAEAPTQAQSRNNTLSISDILEDATPQKFIVDGEDQNTNSTFKIRRLTPLECERLQGFPDGWTEEGTQGKISDTQRYKTLGNAVTVNVIEAIMSKLL